jgi:amidase
MTATSRDELAFAGPGALAQLVREQQVTPRELVELSLERIERLDPQLNAFRVTLAEQALAEADALTDLDRPLAGVPLAVKDDIELAGQARTRGSRAPAPVATEDAEAVGRLRAAGAIPIGVTNVPELMIFPWTATAANGITRNPWDPSRTTGGSSGGSAAAVAAGLVPAATASDGGGSIRIPAANCGLVGMKPTNGRVSSAPHAGGWIGLSTYGALARTVDDSALLFDVMRNREPGVDDAAMRTAAATDPPPLRIGISAKTAPGVITGVDDEQRGAWERTGALLEQLGHDVQERQPAYRGVQVDFIQLWWRGVYEDSLTITDHTLLERSTRQMAALGRYLVPPRRRDAIQGRREQVSRRIMALWDDVDVLVTPALNRTPIAADGAYGRSALKAIDTASRFTPWTAIWNLTGQPAISIPAGTASDGLPLSVQLIGRRGGEETLYALAAQIERAAPWAQRRPPVS